MSTPTVYAWIGGTEAIARWLDAFYDAVERDELLAPVFGGTVTRAHRDHVTARWAEVMVGPAAYTETARLALSARLRSWRSERPSSY